ncbi:MAG TPA: hypothetical protein VK745_12305 [Polyangiaceae bacterium]|nr:hypothetical protein [Polyangiaceae bacterium]
MTWELRTSRWASLMGLGVAGLAALMAWVEVTRLSLFKRFSIDEFQYAHAAWLVRDGKLPYRDFFEFHFPLPYLSYSFFVNDSPASIAHLRLFMLAVFALTSFGLYRINRELGPALALTAPIVAATTTPFVFFATEIRPDAVAFGLFLFALSLLFPAPVGRARAFAVGVLWLLALFATQKAIIYSAPLGAVLLLNALRRRSRAHLLESLGHLLLGCLLIALGIALYFAVTHSAGAWFQQTLVWAAYHERHYPGFAWTVYGVPAFESALVLFGLGLLGAGRSVLALKRSVEPLAEPDLILLLVLASALFSFGFARAPFPYALLPGLGMLCAFVPRGLAALFDATRRLPERARLPGAVLIVVGLLWLGPRLGFAEAEQKLATSNAYQYRVLDDLARVTSVTDPVYDNSGGFVARPHVGFRFYTSALDRQAEAAVLPISVPRAIREQGCTALLLDARFGGLPPALIRYLTLHFQPYGADLWLWGQRFAASSTAPTFEAVRDADYFVEPEGVATSGNFTLDGNVVTSSVFHLSRGLHRIAYAGSVRQFSVLWLPADQQRYRPKYGLRPAFSSIF